MIGSSSHCLTAALLALMLSLSPTTVRGQLDGELLPKHITPETLRSVQKGLEYLSRTQSPDGSWTGSQDGTAYPVTMTALPGMAFLANGCTTSRGPYRENLRRAVNYILSQSQDSGLIACGQENGRPMYGHGFSLMFLSVAHGMETDPKVRERMEKVIKKGIQLTSTGQSNLGGWIYYPGGGDEGSVTVTQMQALRAAHEAGFTVPKATIEKAIRYLEICKTPEGGIRYSYHSGNDTRLPISAAAIACLYSAGEYDSPLAEECLEYVHKQFRQSSAEFGSGHDFYTNFYTSQAFYQAGDDYWDDYFVKTRDAYLKMQDKNGSWEGDGIGKVYGTSIALVILQLPYKFLPIYQR
ncbi:MAG: prenyltransferase/squalene oxidase repeat-containing protein [Planctomycetaceae bacterium]